MEKLSLSVIAGLTGMDIYSKWKLEEYLSLLIVNDKNLLYSREQGFEVSTTIGLLLYNVQYILDLNIEDLCASPEPQKRSAMVNTFF